MRSSSLASFALVSLLAVTAAPVASAASPAGAPRRVAKRADVGARVLPAPVIKDEPLPPLPPPPPAAPMPAVAAAPPAPSPIVASTSPSADRVTSAKGEGAGEVKPTGAVLQMGMGALVPTSAFVEGMSTLGPGVSFDVRAGAYVTPNVGLLLGFRGSYGHSSSQCGSSCGRGYSIQVPVLLQLAQRDRTRGLYGELGLGLATKYGMSGDGYTVSFTSPVEVKLGMGYRLAGARDTRRSSTLDVNVGMDIGKVDHAKIEIAGKSAEGPVDDAATHVVVALSLLAHVSL